MQEREMDQGEKRFQIKITKKRVAAVGAAAALGTVILFTALSSGAANPGHTEQGLYEPESSLYGEVLAENEKVQSETTAEAISDMLVSAGLNSTVTYLAGLQGNAGSISYAPEDLPVVMNPTDTPAVEETVSEAESETEPETEDSETEEPETQEPETQTEEETETEPVTEEETVPETTQEPEADPRTSVWDKYANLGVVIAPNYLHIRTAPSMDGSIVGVLYNMSGVDLLDVSEDGAWYHICSNGVEGYINAEFVVTGEEARQLAYDHAFPAITVNTEVLNVRQEPNTDSTILTQIISGSLYPILEFTNDSWLKISIGSEIEGYVSIDYITWSYSLQDAVEYTPAPEPEPEPEVPAINPVRLQIVNTAMQYLGGRYVWGGTALGVGVDCSGFMLKIFEQFGYALPRTSYWQVNTGVPVSFEEMKPGDLIFYWNNNLGRIGHVALYIGNNQIVHAASEARGIVIDDYRFMTPYCARNVIGE